MLVIEEREPLNNSNEIALSVHGVMQSGIDFKEALEILGLDLTKTERYFLMQRIVKINYILQTATAPKELPKDAVQSYGWDS